MQVVSWLRAFVIHTVRNGTLGEHAGKMVMLVDTE